jgi:hypothetical protein
MGTKSKATHKILGLSVVWMLMPASAYAVSVSSDSGSGEQYRVKTYNNGAGVSGTLRSTRGDNVYYAGTVDLSNCSDPGIGRYSSSTTSRSYVTRGGTIAYFPLTFPCGFQGVRSRVCREIVVLPDSCGSLSSRYWWLNVLPSGVAVASF